MKKQKTQLILLLVLLVIAIGTWQGLKKYNEVQEAKEAEASTVKILSVDPEEITSLTIVNENGTFALAYDGSTWTFSDPDTVSSEWAATYTEDTASDESTIITDTAVTASEVNTSKADTLAGNLENVTGSQEIKDVSDFSLYGLDGAQITVSVTLKDETEYTLTFGDYNETASIYYLRLNEDTSVFSIDSSLYTVFSGVTADDLVEQETEAVTEAATEAATESAN